METSCLAEEGETLKSPFTGKLFSVMLEKLNEKREFGSHEFRIMLLDDAFPIIEEARKSNYCGEWREITEQAWWDALEVLPPEKWQTVRGVEIFRMCEYLSGNITAHYAKLLGKFFARNCSTSEKYEDLAEQIAEKWFD
jgi:hypothetical protein